ncbi:MAG TPA: hypothetical protein VK356_09960 [Thermomicrobiales bacterium]|nr:hypothetical protein [Thermomicrobiales bacterium]
MATSRVPGLDPGFPVSLLSLPRVMGGRPARGHDDLLDSPE